MPNKNRIHLLGCPIDPLTLTETLQIVDAAVCSRRTVCHAVVNAAKLVYMQKNDRLRRSVISADLINADGMSVVYAARFLGRPLRERVTGIDLFWTLLAWSEQKGYRPFLLGAKEDVLRKAVAKIGERYPRLILSGFRSGYWAAGEEASVAREIAAVKPDLLFVGISTPKKETFIHDHAESLGVPFIMGVGGSFDIAAGITKRAPEWMQKRGLEWLFRVIQEPKRMIRRYAVTNTLFIYYVLLEKFRIKDFRIDFE